MIGKEKKGRVFKEKVKENDILRKSKRKRHLPKIRIFKNSGFFFGQTNQQKDIVVHREVTLPKTYFSYFSRKQQLKKILLPLWTFITRFYWWHRRGHHTARLPLPPPEPLIDLPLPDVDEGLLVEGGQPVGGEGGKGLEGDLLGVVVETTLGVSVDGCTTLGVWMTVLATLGSRVTVLTSLGMRVTIMALVVAVLTPWGMAATSPV